MIQSKICIVGAVSVGKTSLVARYVHSLFSDKYLSTVGTKVDKKVVQVDGRTVDLYLWDLAGDDDIQPLNENYLRGASAYLLVVDGTRRQTLEQAVELQGRVSKVLGPAPFLVALNKADLANEWDLDERAMASLSEKGWHVRRTSAKDGMGVETTFVELARRIFAMRVDKTS